MASMLGKRQVIGCWKGTWPEGRSESSLDKVFTRAVSEQVRSLANEVANRPVGLGNESIVSIAVLYSAMKWWDVVRPGMLVCAK
jgi:hypothetical protein